MIKASALKRTVNRILIKKLATWLREKPLALSFVSYIAFNKWRNRGEDHGSRSDLIEGDIILAVLDPQAQRVPVLLRLSSALILVASE